jgi:hypothetical protein
MSSVSESQMSTSVFEPKSRQEDQRSVLARTRNVLAETRLALVVVPDRRILRHLRAEAGNPRAERMLELVSLHGGAAGCRRIRGRRVSPGARERAAHQFADRPG